MAENVKKGVSVFTGCMVGNHELIRDLAFPNNDYDMIIKIYRKPGIFDNVDRDWFDKRRAIELGMAGKLLENMCEAGAKTEEFKHITLYCHILIDAVKYELDFPQVAKDLEIAELKEKYQVKKEETK